MAPTDRTASRKAAQRTSVIVMCDPLWMRRLHQQASKEGPTSLRLRQ